MYGASIMGHTAMLAFTLFLLMGPWPMVDMNLSSGGWVLWNLVLSFLFFVQHSGMMRQGFRSRLSHVIPSYYHNAIFALASSLVLIILVIYWQPSNIFLINPPRPVRWLFYGLFFLAAAGMAWGVVALQAFDPFGRLPIKRQLSGKPAPSQPFTVKGPYLWVRHPLYFFALVMIWSRADLTADRLLFNLVWTGWIYVGTRLEERDLLFEFGNHYQRYQKTVPMLIPWKGIGNMPDIETGNQR